MKFSQKFLTNRLKNFPYVSVITFVLATFFFLTVAPLNAFGALQEKSPLDVYTLNYDKGKWDGWMDSVVKSMSEYVTGPKQETISSGTTSNGLDIPYVAQGGAIYEIARVSDTLYEMPPASFIVWAQDQYYQVREGVSFTALAADPQDTSSYAPGIGYNILQPVMGLWQWSRNIVYGFYIVILIAISFLIILRRPMGGQEIVTIANSIPSVIISLVLVTFSYAICGLFIDAIYLGTNVVYSFLVGAPNAPGHELVNPIADPNLEAINPTATPTPIQVYKWDAAGRTSPNTVNIANVLQPDDPQMSIWNIFALSKVNVCNTLFGGGEKTCSFSYLVPAAAQNNIIGQSLSTMLGLVEKNKVGNALIELILALAVFQTAFKLFTMLLKEYILLSFYPVIAPFIFLGAALPSNTNKTLSDFFKTMGGATLTFITVYAMFLLLIVFGYSSADSTTQLGAGFSQAGQIKWAPPLLGYTNEQIFDATTLNNGGYNIITSLLVFGLYMAIPNVIGFVKKALEVASPFQVMQATGKDVTGVGKKALGTIESVVNLFNSKGQIFGK